MALTAEEQIRLDNDLFQAVSEENVKDLQRCINAGANVNVQYNVIGTKKDGYTPLYLAVNKGNIDMVKALLDGGADIYVGFVRGSRNFVSPLSRARLFDRKEIEALLIERGADSNVKYCLYKLNNLAHGTLELVKNNKVFSGVIALSSTVAAVVIGCFLAKDTQVAKTVINSDIINGMMSALQQGAKSAGQAIGVVGR